MSQPFRIFIGYDRDEPVALYALMHSLHERSSIPLQIAPLNRATLTEVYKRPRGQYDSTDFSVSRFLVPFLCDYKGWALYLDCDMLARRDVAELAAMCNIANWYKSVLVCKHDYVPRDEIKFLGHLQTKYAKKNWSSLMLFNNERCKKLTPEYVESCPGLALHRFEWTTEEQVGSVPLEWNWLVGEYAYREDAKLVHFTRGGPYFAPFAECEYADEWRECFESMIYAEKE